MPALSLEQEVGGWLLSLTLQLLRMWPISFPDHFILWLFPPQLWISSIMNYLWLHNMSRCWSVSGLNLVLFFNCSHQAPSGGSAPWGRLQASPSKLGVISVWVWSKCARIPAPVCPLGDLLPWQLRGGRKHTPGSVPLLTGQWSEGPWALRGCGNGGKHFEKREAGDSLDLCISSNVNKANENHLDPLLSGELCSWPRSDTGLNCLGALLFGLFSLVNTTALHLLWLTASTDAKLRILRARCKLHMDFFSCLERPCPNPCSFPRVNCVYKQRILCFLHV